MITLREIARKMGISHSTISICMNGKADRYGISRVTQKRVKDALEKYGYLKNPGVSELSGKHKTNKIGLIFGAIREYFLRREFDILCELFYMRDYQVLHPYLHSFYEKEKVSNKESADSYVNAIIDLRTKVDAYVVHFSNAKIYPKLLDILKKAGKPYVFYRAEKWHNIESNSLQVDRFHDLPKLKKIIDQREYENFFFLSSQTPEKSYHKYPQYKELIPELEFITPSNPHYSHKPSIERDQAYMEYGADIGMKLYKRYNHKPFFCFASNDFFAQGAMFSLAREGLIAGKDYSIVGFDDIPAAKFMNPPLTTFSQPSWELSNELVEMITKQLSGKIKAPFAPITKSCSLIIRDSVGDRNI
jgi:DNA-binding LacI/PurR family transcriptional regulator